MTTWSLPNLLSELHLEIEGKLAAIRRTIGHPGAKGDASENVWIKMLSEYLPQRYDVDKAFVVDSRGVFSQQIDVVIYDRQYSPFIFHYNDQKVIPAESVYAVFEAKQTVGSGLIAYAQEKAASVRRLHRTTMRIPHAGGRYEPKPPAHIISGILSLASEWKPPLGRSLEAHLLADTGDGLLDIGCLASHGHFNFDGESRTYDFVRDAKPATAFLFKLIAMLQASGTVSMIDIDAYAKWLTPEPVSDH